MISPQPLVIRREREGGLCRLTPVGEVDLATVPHLEHAFREAYADRGVEMIVLDLGELGFIDSSGLHALLRMTAVCEASDRLRVVGGSPAFERLVEIAGVRDLLPLISPGRDPVAPLPSQPLRRPDRG